MNVSKTEQWGKLPEEYWYIHSGKCEVKIPDQEWVISTCDEWGYHERMFQDAGCTVPVTYIENGGVDFKWDECISLEVNNNNTFIPRTTQKDFTYDWRDRQGSSAAGGE